MMVQTSSVHVRYPATPDVDHHAAHCRHLWRRRRVQRQRRSSLRARVPAPVRRTKGRQLLQRRRQRLRLCGGPALPARVDDDDDGGWLWPGTTNVLVRTSKPPANCHNSRHGSRISARWDVVGWCRFTNNAPYVVAVMQRAPVSHLLAHGEDCLSVVNESLLRV